MMTRVKRQYRRAQFMPNRDRKSTDNSLFMKRKTLVRKGSAQPYDARDHGYRPRMHRSHAKERPQEHPSHENEAPSPRRDGIHRGSPSYPDKVFDEFMGGAPAGHQSYRSPSYYVPNFPPPWASAQQPEFYSNSYPDLSSPFIPMQFQQGGYHYPDRPTPPPAEVKPNPQMEQMKRQLELLQAERREQAESQTRAQYEERIRQDAERAFKIRMEEMQRAQEEAKREIELAKVAAERAMRERLEKEQKQLEEQRKAEEKQREYALAKAELEIRQKLEGGGGANYGEEAPIGPEGAVQAVFIDAATLFLDSPEAKTDHHSLRGIIPNIRLSTTILFPCTTCRSDLSCSL